MSTSSDLLIAALGMDPALSEIVAITNLAKHLAEARKITSYQIGTTTYLLNQFSTLANPAHVSLAEHRFLDFYLSAHGNVTDGQTTYTLDSERYFWSDTNTASVNGQPIPGGLVLHLAEVAPDVSTNLGAKVTLAYTFHSTPQTPTISLLAETTIGMLKNSPRT